MKQRLIVLSLALFGIACSESTAIRTYPPNAKVSVDDTVIGVSPVEFRYPSWSMGGKTFRYRAERDGYLPAEGRLKTRVAPGRIVAAVFTSCITCLFHGFKTFEEQTNIELTPLNGQVVEKSGETAAIAERLRRIQDLYDQGLMTEQEYKRYRSEILHDAAGATEPTTR
jgi:hypothetical protein